MARLGPLCFADWDCVRGDRTRDFPRPASRTGQIGGRTPALLIVSQRRGLYVREATEDGFSEPDGRRMPFSPGSREKRDQPNPDVPDGRVPGTEATS